MTNAARFKNNALASPAPSGACREKAPFGSQAVRRGQLRIFRVSLPPPEDPAYFEAFVCNADVGRGDNAVATTQQSLSRAFRSCNLWPPRRRLRERAAHIRIERLRCAEPFRPDTATTQSWRPTAHGRDEARQPLHTNETALKISRTLHAERENTKQP